MKTQPIIILIVILLSLQMAIQVSASTVEIEATSDSGTIEFICTGDHTNFDVDVSGFYYSNVDIKNEWNTVFSKVQYENVETGTIYLRATDVFSGDSMFYYRWDKMPIRGNGIYVPPGNGGRYVNVIDAPNITGFIEYPVKDHKAAFIFDSRYSGADLTVIVHNGELIENATVIVHNGDQEVKWTDEIGEAKFSPSTGLYNIIVEHENHSTMVIEELIFDSDKLYRVYINMSDGRSSHGVVSGEDIVIQYADREPNLGTISPQGFVDFFADQMRTCRGGDNPQADGTLERMATKWGVYPKNLSILLYSCTIEDLGCIDDSQDLKITYTLKNYQEYECSYVVTLMTSSGAINIGSGVLPKTWHTGAKETFEQIVSIEDCVPMSTVYLAVDSKRAS